MLSISLASVLQMLCSYLETLQHSIMLLAVSPDQK